MNVAPTLAPAPTDGPEHRIRFTPSQLVGLSILAALIAAAISILVTHAIDYDPDGWIVYAREVFGPGVLDTSGFPAWKPLPVLIEGPFTLLTRGEADVYFWLLVARTAGILAVIGVGAIAYRLGGPWAGLLAAVLLVIAPWWLQDTVLGRDGPPAAALVAAAILAHHRGWYRVAGLCGIGVALLRPEAAPFVAAYGVWSWRTGRITPWETLAALAAIVLLWLVPSLLHAGKSPATISTLGGAPGSAIRSSTPFLQVIVDTAKQMRIVPALLVLVACLSSLHGLSRRQIVRPAALWGRSPEEQVLLLGAIVWILGVAAETQYGFAGNPRYLISALTVLTVIAAVVAVRLGSRVRIAGSTRWSVLAVVAITLAATAVSAPRWIRDTVNLTHLRDFQVASMRRELAELHCPGYVWTDAANNAYLAQITGQSLAASLFPTHRPLQVVDGNLWFVYCAPATWKPSGKA